MAFDKLKQINYEPAPLSNNALLELVQQAFELDGCLRFNWMGDNPVRPEKTQMAPAVREIVDKIEAIYRVLNLYGVTNEQGEFIPIPSNIELENSIRTMSDVYDPDPNV